MPYLTEQFRNAFRSYPTGVAIITARVDDRPVGMTISSLASLALDPLALAFSISNAAGSGGDFLRAPSYLFHLLSVDQANLADIFSQPAAMDERFTEQQGWDVLPTGEPYLPTAPWALRARPLGNLEAGSARLVAAEVVNILQGPVNEPLLYHNRTFLGVQNTREPVAGED